VTGRPAARDGGETLVELLVTVVILGIATSGISAALVATVNASNLHRQEVLARHSLRAWAEQIGVGTYTACAAPSNFAAPSPALPSGLTAAVPSVSYWDGTSFASSCDTDTGVQKVTLRITARNGLSAPRSRDVEVVVRKPCVSAC
jgi:type II secretory pathway pseudopilin PulG